MQKMSMQELSFRQDYRVDVAGTGFTVLDRVYADGDLADEALGGSCGNVLVSLAMLHRHVVPVLALGNDDTGKRLIDEFLQAGATINYIARRADLRSPILAQELDTASGRHDFSFVCPETREDLPRYQPISETELAVALPMLSHCSVFYIDRLSDNILEAVRAASAAGAVIFFEPSDFEETELFEEALRLATILKYSADRLGERLADRLIDCVHIITYGSAGLEIRDRGEAIWCEAIGAPAVLDTCGSGDMVSVGVIDWMLTKQFEIACLKAADLLEGIIAGQRLAAENCAYAGARGLFKKRGANYVREILSVRSARF
ncbi:PfkB family carbohydrate kinase [Oricola indica]|jgi:fructokinase|uniref:PfkB family carbohydrate kinase n=1 Tax=Oricola indica TaxID=2872591 RepID=UPI001CBC6354|nr:PfkB family carbohydrate kinase [Oricola indica]